MRVEFAPVKDQMLDEDGVLTNGWLQWFSNVGIAVTGEWTSEDWQLDITGVSETPDEINTVFKGKTIEITIVWLSGANFSNAEIKIPYGNGRYMQFREGILRMWVSASFEGGISVSGDTISPSDVDTTGVGNKTIIEGTIILQEAQE